MKIFLASNAKNPSILKEIDKFVGGFKDKKIVFIPTASNGEIGYELWKTESQSLPVIKGLGANVSILQLEDYKFDSESVLNILKTADIIWMGGGMPGYLLYWLRRTKADAGIKMLLESGVYYVGSSAGSMVASKYSDLAEWYIDEMEPGASAIPGLGLVDFEFYPHFVEENFEKIKVEFSKRHKSENRKIYLVKDDEAIVINGDSIQLIGNPALLTS